MADKSFGVKQLNLIGASGTPKIDSPNNLNLNAINVAISTDLSIGGQVTSNIIVQSGKSIGIGSTTPQESLTIVGSVKISGVSTFDGLVKLDSTLGDIYGNVGSAASILTSTGAGVSWTAPFAAGLQGLQGLQGTEVQGTQGLSVQGLQGIQGLQGLSVQGTQGLQGTEVQGTQGLQGTEVQGLQGTQGLSVQGTQGLQGTEVQGLQGIQGLQGLSVQGTQGLQGTEVQGLQGAQGLQGTTGPVAGSDTEVIFNDGGIAGASSNFTFDKNNSILQIATVGAGVTISAGIVTATNGFSSGIGTSVQVTTVGDQLIFTVPGVGTTSFTLFV